MHTIHKAEILEIRLEVDKEEIKSFLKNCVDFNFYMHFSENSNFMLISLKQDAENHPVILRFARHGEFYHLQNKVYTQNQDLLVLIEKMIVDNLGDALIKEERNEQVEVRQIRQGEVVSLEIVGTEKHITFQKHREEKEQVKVLEKIFKDNTIEREISFIKQEMDDYLEKLQAAIESSSQFDTERYKKVLQRLHKRLYVLESV